ncbi:MAG: 50S ribosomal protein L18 [Phycisphaerae bacterium]|nr:50S ribosomal protein L18 [Phycisphaerae bacterium]
MRIDRIKSARRRRKLRVHKRVIGTSDRPRLSVFRSNRHMYAQIIDDIAGVTLASASTRVGGLKKTGNIDAAKIIGAEIAKQAMQVGIKAVRFDRSRFKYHGRVKSLAMAAREAGLVF